MMTHRYHYTITVKVNRKGLVTLPVADFHVEGVLDPGEDFTGQIGRAVAEELTRIRPRLEKARRL